MAIDMAMAMQWPWASAILWLSDIVSAAAVVLKPAQEANKTRDLKRNILLAAGLLDPSLSVEEQFEQVETRVVNLDEGRFVVGVDPAGFDQREAAKDPAQSRALEGDEDPAKLVRREDQALVYLVRDDAGGLDKIILSIFFSNNIVKPTATAKKVFPVPAGPAEIIISLCLKALT